MYFNLSRLSSLLSANCYYCSHTWNLFLCTIGKKLLWNMGSTALAPIVEKVNTLEQASRKRSSGKRNQRKVPKRVHKAEREKMKREHWNELFLGLVNALDLSKQSNGKACILREATRLPKDLLSQIESLKKENASLLYETHYITVEKNEVEEENSVLETQIEKLKGDIEARVGQSRPDLNAPSDLELQQSEMRAEFQGESLQLSTIDPTLQQV
ncbi:hypothetical protein VNO77_42497 [Canavalia gladiata]|uniref:BHLH domain-containing protein n=1 Tax=Canavalia gladiata TaxID=3824 RepID=A0AAN9JSY9_CANGL